MARVANRRRLVSPVLFLARYSAWPRRPASTATMTIITTETMATGAGTITTVAATRRTTMGMTVVATKDMATKVTATKAVMATRAMVTKVAMVTRAVVTATRVVMAVKAAARAVTAVKVAMAVQVAAEVMVGLPVAEAMAAQVVAEVTAEAVAAVVATAAVAGRAGTEASSDMGGSAGPGMPRYKCHKVVHALQISHVFGNEVHFVDVSRPPFRGEPGMFARYMPVRGDYLVFYGGANDYKSFSPRTTFEEGYSPFPEGEQGG